MGGPKVAFYELEEWEIPFIQSRLKDFEVVKLSTQTLDEDRDVPYDADVLSVFIYSRLSEEVLSRFSSLKLITTRSTGYDHIDLEYAKERGIVVCNVPDYGTQTVAEYTIMLILNLLRKFKPTLERVSHGVFSREGLRGEDFHGKTLGVIGTGRIGERVATIAKAFGVNVLATDPNPKENLIKMFGVRYVALEELLSASDIITIHVPYNSSTHHLINRENIKLVKRGSYLVNTSRGGVVETEAIVWAIKEGILKGVAMDTFEGEEVWIEEELILSRADISGVLLKKAIENFYLLRWENTILTPHNAYNTEEALRRILDTTIDNIVSFFEKRQCPNAVVRP